MRASLGCGLMCTLFLTRGDAAETGIATIAQLRAVSFDEASRGLPLTLEATVVYHDPQSPVVGLYVADGTGVDYVSSEGTNLSHLRSLGVKVGDRIRIRGVTRGGGYVPDICQEQIEVIAPGKLPVPKVIGMEDLFSPRFSPEWVEVPAIVEGAEMDGDVVVLNVEVYGLNLKALLPRSKYSLEKFKKVIQRHVRLQGVASTLFNVDRQMTGRYFHVPSFDQIIPVDPVAVESPPLCPINELLRCNADSKKIVLIEGVVTQNEGTDFFLRDATGSLRVHSPNTVRYSPGDLIRAEGFATVVNFRPEFRARNLVKAGSTVPPPPKKLSYEQEKRPTYQCELIEMDAELVSVRQDLNRWVLQCISEKHYFEAYSPPNSPQPEGIAPGAQIRLKGICELMNSHPLARYWNIDGFRLLLPKKDGLVILKPASWWTNEHLKALLAAATSLILLTGVWILQQRRSVNRQVQIISEQLKALAEKEERERIARELHDTLEQELASLAMLLGSIPEKISKMPDVARTSVQLAQKILRHCQEESRSSISDLRNIELKERGLAGALKHLFANPKTEGGGPELTVQVTGREYPLPGITGNHLVRIAQESVANALKHARAKKIRVDLEYNLPTVTLTITDDGCGFDVNQSPAVGHFGLMGIQERANKIQGQLTLHSAPQAGTRITVVLTASPVEPPK